jgi:hypothetical protein
MQSKKLHRSEAEELYFCLMNDPTQFEKGRYTDSINVYSSIIEDFQKLYESTPIISICSVVTLLSEMN